jgi:uncharacterized protein with von Willebrand factor type A (vWA) domain
MASLAEVAAGFAEALRADGLSIPLSSVATFARALDEVGFAPPDAVYWAGHSSFVRRPEDRTPYGTVFARYFSDSELYVHSPMSRGRAVDDAVGDAAGVPIPTTEADGPLQMVRYSAAEILSHKDFAACSDEELRDIARLMRNLIRHPARRRSRRRAATRRPRGTLDLRRTVRETVRHGGETPRLHRLGPTVRDRPVVLLLDVSGSMDPYSRAFLEFAHATVSVRRRVEVFALGTRLTRITRMLAWHDPSRAVAAASESVADMSGGTRLGEALAEFNARYGVAGMARGAVVVIFSDGWDRGDPEQIGREMGRLDRVAHRIVWVNPLKSAPGYAPLAQGMAAALPYVDDFLEGHSLDSLGELVDVMER